MSEPVCWDGSLQALKAIQDTMPDCLLWHDAGAGILYVRTEANPEAAVPFGWHVTRAGDGIAVISPERREIA